MSIIAKYKFDSGIYADLLPEFNSEFTSDLYTVTDEVDSNVTTRTIESDSLPTLMRFGVAESSVATERSKSLLEIISLDISNCTQLYHYFKYCINLTTVNGLVVHSGITNLDNTFGDCNSLEFVDTSNWDTSNVTTMYSTFNSCTNLTTLDVSNWNTSNVTTMQALFYYCTNLTSLNVSNWNTSKVINMVTTFAQCTKLTSLNVSNWDTSNVTTMSYMFAYCQSLTSLDLHKWNTDNMTNMRESIAQCNSLITLDISNWNTSKVNDISNLLYEATSLNYVKCNNIDTMNKIVSLLPTRTSDNPGTIICKSDTTDLDTTTLQSKYWTVDTSDGTMIAKYKFDKSIYNSLIPEFNSEFSGYFCNDVIEDNIVTREIVGYGGLPTLMRFGSNLDTYVEGNELALLEVLDMNTSGLTSCTSMFRYCKNLTSITCEWDTSNVTGMYAMFSNCNNLTSLDVSNFNTSNTTNIYAMFNGCNKLTTLDLGNWDTSKVTNMAYMFYACNNLISLDISNFNTSNVTNTTNMFNNTLLLTDIGMLYCDQSTINKIASSLPTDTTQTIWVEDVDVKDLTPVEGVEFKQYAKNTEVMLTSPLLEGDKIEVKDGKLYHYHKMGMVVLDGSEDWKSTSDENILVFYYLQTNVPLNANRLICDKFKTTDETCNNYGEVHYGGKVNNRNGNIVFSYDSKDVTTWKNWLSENPTTIIYELAEPYYELISEDPLTISLIAESSDITNSSNIPLNMTINNKGLATIAMSPSTTYTVAFDKNTDSEVVVNLCGNEVTTTDNIVEITTPSEIDDELIFYGDGVEVSNIRLLEGSMSGDSVPRETFEGLKSSFEDGYIPEPIFTNIEGGIVNSASLMAQPFTEIRNDKFYTLHIEVTENTLNSLLIWELTPTYGQSRLHVQPGETGIFTCVVETPGSAVANTVWQTTNVGNGTSVTTKEGSATVKNLIILEGDWAHLTEEDWNNLGKYKVEYKVTGKNKFDGELLQGAWNSDTEFVNTSIYVCTKNRIKVKPSTDYIISNNLTLTSSVVFIGKNGEDLGLINYNDKVYFTTPNNCEYVKIDWHKASGVTPNDFTNLQLEEGTVATSYEPYKEYTKTFYLNSPLLEGDTIEDVNGVATHVKRYEKVVLNGSEDWSMTTSLTNTTRFNYTPQLLGDNIRQGVICDNIISVAFGAQEDIEGICNWETGIISCKILNSRLSTQDTTGFKQWLSQNPTTVVYELASPIYEPISDESILCDSYVNGHLDVNTNIPIEKVEFIPTSLALAYLQPSTSYTVQFESDNVGEIVFGIGGTDFGKYIVHKGLNKFHGITNSSLTNDRLWMSGIGFNASNIQVVATDRDVNFGYFKGLQSSFESCYPGGKNLFDKNDIIPNMGVDTKTGEFVASEELHSSNYIPCKPNTLYICNSGQSCHYFDGDKKWISNVKYDQPSPSNAKYLIKTFSTTVDINLLQLEEGNQITEYEPFIDKYKVEYKVTGKNLFDVNEIGCFIQSLDAGSYNNGVLTIKKSDILASTDLPINLKRNIPYTISFNYKDLGNVSRTEIQLVIYYEDGTRELIRPYNLTGSSEGKVVYTINNTTLNKTIRFSYVASTALTEFTNIQLEEGTQATSYEPYQEYTKTIYLNSPLLKGDTIEVHNGKLCHYHKMGMVVLDGSEDWNMTNNLDMTCRFSSELHIDSKGTTVSNTYIWGYSISDNFLCDNKSTYDRDEECYQISNINGSIYIRISKSKLSTQDTSGFKQWLSNNPTTVVCELAEPYYEEIEPTQEDLILTSVKEGGLHIDTIVPVSSKVTYNVNVQLLTDFEQSIVEQVQATQTTDLQSILDEEIDN